MHASPPRRLSGALALLAALLVLAPPAAAAGDVDAEGPIEALGAASVTVQGLTFAVTDQTEIVDDDDRPLSFSDLGVGLVVDVDGRQLADGSLVADEIEVEADGGVEVEAEGVVTARTDASLTVAGLTFAVTDQTEVFGEDEAPLAFSAVVVGLSVEVEGVLLGDGALVASEIEVDDDPNGDGEEIEVEGLIEALSAESLTVSGISFGIVDHTVVVDDDGAPLTLDTLAIGLRVEVDGRYAGGTLVADRIEVEDFDDDELELRGAIDALGASSFGVLGLSFAVTDATVFVGDDDQPLAFSDLSLGDVVEVYAVVDAAGAFTATRVELEDDARAQQEVEVKASLDAVGEGFIVVLGLPFLVADTTPVLGLSDEAISLADLPVGQSVEVDARRDADGTLTALHVEREDDPANEVRLRARVTGFAPDTVIVLQVPFAAADARVVRDDGTDGTLADLAVGQDVLVTGTQDATGAQAHRIEILRSASAAGRVLQTTAGGFALPGLAVATDAQTLVTTESGAPASLDDLAVDTDVRAYGTVDEAGVLAASWIEVLPASVATSASDGPVDPLNSLGAVFPNPTRESATVRVALSGAATVRLDVLDLLGRTVRTAESAADAGTHDLDVSVRGLSPGVYLVRLAVDGRPAGTSRLTVLR